MHFQTFRFCIHATVFRPDTEHQNDIRIQKSRMGGRRLDLQKLSHLGQKKKKFDFSSKHRIVNVFSNIPFLDSCDGVQTGHGTPETHQNIKKPNGRPTFGPPKTVPPWTEKKRFHFSSKHWIVNVFSNIPFLNSWYGVQTGHGTPERHQNLKAEWAADVWTSKTRPTMDRKKKSFFFRVDPE